MPTQEQIDQAQKAKSLLDTYDAKSEELAKLNCLLYDDLTFFDLRELAKFNPISAGGLYFTFCGRTKDEQGDKTFAYYTTTASLTSSIFGQGVDIVRLTGDGRPSKTLAVEDTDPEKPRHIYFEISGGE